MAVIQDRKAPQMPTADHWPPASAGRRRRSRRTGHRLWAVLNAQALLNGTAGTPGGVLPVEDDRRRLAARRAN
jgi:hypothetical protein